VSPLYGVATAWTTPTAMPPNKVIQSDLSCPISAAAIAEMTRNVSAE
jgi:hypothetical protein